MVNAELSCLAWQSDTPSQLTQILHQAKAKKTKFDADDE
jgi:hypothetical protein